MGCGALCGDTTTAENMTSRHSKRYYQKLVDQLAHNPELMATPLYSAFLQHYQLDPDAFHLQNRTQLIRDQPISANLMLKWKLILCGLDKNDKKYCECLGITHQTSKQVINNEGEADNHEDGGILVHDCFVQIEKDIERTFDTPVAQGKKKQFENVLKRIANHFPKMGYTQGINFIVSYLIVIGYSESDSFEMFVHLATNQRYLLLGLYEDGFPLYSIFNTVFQNVLRRVNEALYLHMFVLLGVDPSMWICKWFMTFYIYSFPKQLVKYVWDLVIGVGNLGMIMFAVSLIQQLQPIIFQITELSDLNDFLASLKNLETFNEHVNLQHLMTKAYSVVLISSDFDDVETDNFYGVCVKACFSLSEEGQDNTDVVVGEASHFLTLLDNWRASLIEERNNFRRNNKTTNISNLRLQIESLQKSVNKGSNIEEGAVAPLDEPNTMDSTSEMVKVRKKSISSKSEALVAVPPRVEYQFNEINEKVEEEQQSVGSKPEVKSKHSKKPQGLDELDKLELQFEQVKKQAPVLTRNHFSNPQQLKRPINKATYNNQCNSLSLAGRNSLRNDNSMDDVSVSSKQTSNKSKIKNAPIVPVAKNSRICACKTKTEENRFSNVEHGSEIEESKDQFSDKDSISISNNNYSQNGQSINDTHSIRGIDSHRDHIIIQKDFMVNSHGPGVLGKREEGRTQDIEVMVLQFKKNKRGRVKQMPVELRPANKLFNIGQQEEDSIEQIHPTDRLSQAHSHCSHMGNAYEIQSIK